MYHTTYSPGQSIEVIVTDAYETFQKNDNKQSGGLHHYLFSDEGQETLMQDPTVRGIVKERRGDISQDSLADLLTNGLEETNKGNKADPDSRAFMDVYDIAAKTGYTNGEVMMELYEDADSTLRTMKTKYTVAIFSSSGVTKLGVQTTSLRDAADDFRYYSPADVGNKTEADTYRKIARKMGTTTGKMAFISDSETETAAAVEAGVGVVVLVDRKNKYRGGERVNGCYVAKSFSDAAEHVDEASGEDAESSEGEMAEAA